MGQRAQRQPAAHGPDGPGSKKVGEQWPPIWRDEDIPLTLRPNVTEKFWAGNAAQEDTTGPEYGYIDPKTGEAVAGTVAGKLTDYYDTSVEDHEREQKRLADLEKAGMLGNGNGITAEEVDDVDEDKE